MREPESFETVLQLLDYIEDDLHTVSHGVRVDDAVGMLTHYINARGRLQWTRALKRHGGNARIKGGKWLIKVSSMRRLYRTDPVALFTVLAHEAAHCHLGHCHGQSRRMTHAHREHEAELFMFMLGIELGVPVRAYTEVLLSTGYHGRWRPDVYGLDLVWLYEQAEEFAWDLFREHRGVAA